MKEFYYTACPIGKRADDPRPTAGGFGVRAMSVGIDRLRLDAATRLADAEFPKESPRQLHGELARLALLKIRDGGLVLFHSVIGGSDEANRKGFPFTHALVDLPSDFEPRQAILTWGSRDWKREYNQDALELPGSAAFPTAGSLSTSGLALFLSVEQNRSMTAYAIAASLVMTSTARLFLYAEPSHVAWVLYALTLVLPPEEQRELTFSTYEKGVLDVNARVVGTFANPRENDLPSACYSRSYAAYNRETSRTGAKFSSAYANQAVAWLQTEQIDQPMAFLGLASRLKVPVGEDLDDLIVLETRPEELEVTEFLRLLGKPTTADYLLASPRAVDRALTIALETGSQSLDLILKLVESAVDGSIRETILLTVERAALRVTQSGLTDDLDSLLEILGRVDPARRKNFAALALKELNPSSLSWPIRRKMLQLLQRNLQEPPASLNSWLAVDLAELPELLTLKLPDDWEVLAWKQSIRRPLSEPALISLLISNPKRLVDVHRALELIPGTGDWLVLAIDQAPLRKLFDAFEASGGSIPPRVCDRVLNDRSEVRFLLGRPNVLSRLKHDSTHIDKLMIWAVEDGDALHLTESRVKNTLGVPTLAKAATDIGWQALRLGKLEQAAYAFDKVLASLGQSIAISPPARFKLRDCSRQVQHFLLQRVLDAKQETLLGEWLADLSPEVLTALIGDPRVSSKMTREAICLYVQSQGKLPANAGLWVGSVQSLVDLLIWLADPVRKLKNDLSIQLINEVLEHHSALEDELRAEVLRQASLKPFLWPLADQFLGRWLARESANRSLESVVPIAQMIVENFGCTEFVHQAVERVLNARPVPPIAWKLVSLVENSARIKPPGGVPRPSLLALIEYERLSENQGDDMTAWTKLLDLIHFLESHLQTKRVIEKLEEVRLGLISPGKPETRVRWLKARVTDLGKSFRSGEADAFERILDHILTSPESSHAFWNDIEAVFACHAVGLDLLGSGIHYQQHARSPGSTSRQYDNAVSRSVLQRLTDETWKQGGDELFLDIAHHTAHWAPELFDEWKRHYRESKARAVAPMNSADPAKKKRLFRFFS